ncbi:MAG TPA: Calx-beta domain-containing protein [Lysobacter sp.]
MRRIVGRLLLAFALLLLVTPAATAQQCPATVPVQGAPPPAPLPVFPADNWWNTDIRSAPVDSASASFIAFINNGGNRRLHPDFGGEESPGSTGIYGFPYVIVDGSQSKKAVTFDYWDESDGVDYTTGEGVPFYPIPSQAITQAHWVEGGAPGNIDLRDESDRHVLMIDCTNRHLYELFNVYYHPTQAKWYAGSGAFFDMDRNDRRPDTWTSADAAGLAIFPGLVRYDEAANPAVAEIRHAFRVTVRSTNGYVYPASHAAGSTAGALPMGARLRLKTSVNGADPALRTSDPVARKIFRAMQKYGLIVADNGTDMYISGTFDVRWDNGILNPAFSTLSANDFEVVQRGWKPAPAALSTVSASPNPVYGGQSATGTVRLTAPAPSGGANVALASASPAFTVPASVTVAPDATSATFAITTAAATTTATGTLSATYAGTTRTTAFTVTPTPPALSIANATISEGNSGPRLLTFTVKLSRASTTAVGYTIATANSSAAAGSDYVSRTLAGESIAAGLTSRTFAVTVNGDTAKEANEAFAVTLSAPVGAIIAQGQAYGVILNDDGPTLSVDNVAVSEGNAGTRLATFTVRLSQAAAGPVAYAIATANGSAAAGSDYTGRALPTETIAAGTTSRTFAVTVHGDTTTEGNETFAVNLSAAVGATIADHQGIGTVINDDGPTLSIADASLDEGDTGTRLATFTVKLSQAAPGAVTYSIATAQGSAAIGSDYVARTLTGEAIASGQTSKAFTVTVNGDPAPEAGETFLVNLSAATGATIADSQAVGTIVNDD